MKMPEHIFFFDRSSLAALLRADGVRAARMGHRGQATCPRRDGRAHGPHGAPPVAGRGVPPAGRGTGAPRGLLRPALEDGGDRAPRFLSRTRAGAVAALLSLALRCRRTSCATTRSRSCSAIPPATTRSASASRRRWPASAAARARARPSSPSAATSTSPGVGTLFAVLEAAAPRRPRLLPRGHGRVQHAGHARARSCSGAGCPARFAGGLAALVLAASYADLLGADGPPLPRSRDRLPVRVGGLALRGGAGAPDAPRMAAAAGAVFGAALLVRSQVLDLLLPPHRRLSPGLRDRGPVARARRRAAWWRALVLGPACRSAGVGRHRCARSASVTTSCGSATPRSGRPTRTASGSSWRRTAGSAPTGSSRSRSTRRWRRRRAARSATCCGLGAGRWPSPLRYVAARPWSRASSCSTTPTASTTGRPTTTSGTTRTPTACRSRCSA